MLDLNARQSKVFLILVSILVLLAGFNIYREFSDAAPVVDMTREDQFQFAADAGVEQEKTDDVLQDAEHIASDEKLYIKVYITGQVKRPGVIEIEEGSRLSEVVELAGGLLQDADLQRINLAARVIDEGMYIVPKIGEELPPAVVSPGPASSSPIEEGKVNINTADQTLLETLPGIGPARAQGIIDYREKNGPFTSVEELKDVSGIGDKIFEDLRELVTIN